MAIVDATRALESADAAPTFVRDSDELLQEVYPRMAHCDPEWMELRELP